MGLTTIQKKRLSKGLPEVIFLANGKLLSNSLPTHKSDVPHKLGASDILFDMGCANILNLMNNDKELAVLSMSKNQTMCYIKLKSIST